MKRFVLLFIMLVIAVACILAQGHVSIHQTTGDSLQYNILNGAKFSPELRDGKVVWSFKEMVDTFSVENVGDITFRSSSYSEAMSRKALTELYQATGGDNWLNHTNWCSEKPLSEWYGVGAYPYVTYISLVGNNLNGEMPDCFSAIPMFYIEIANNKQLTGSLPLNSMKNPSLLDFNMSRNQLTGTIPEVIGSDQLRTFQVSNNNLTGPIPEGLTALMDMNAKGLGHVSIDGNDLSGTVPEVVVKHPRFPQLWDRIVPQRGHLEIPTIPAPDYVMKDINGQIVDMTDVYKNNQYTLIFNYGPFSGALTDKVMQAYKAYKDKGFEVIGMVNYNNVNIKGWLHDNDVQWINFDEDAWGQYFQDYYLINVMHLVDNNGNIVFTSLMDDKGVSQADFSTDYCEQVFPFLEEKFGKVEYNYYTSTDYSKDGEVLTLQKATVGNGVDIVFVGDGFVDKDMNEGGKYERKMREAMEQYFAYEPFTSLRNRFNVYAVKAVSANAEFSEGSSHAINGIYDAYKYAQKITDLIPDRPMRVNVIYNSYNAGRSICYMQEDGSYVALAMDGVSTTLNHEGGGHGFGRLLDEYTEFGCEETYPSDEYISDFYENTWGKLGRGANVDFTNDVTKVKWAKFAADNRYTAEQIGVYEGAGTFGHGCYRPTDQSMMRYNNYPFNAPSREAIYKFVMRESEGDSWTYDYETFVAFDEAGRKEFANAINPKYAPKRVPKMASQQQMSAPPVFIKGSWRDVVNKK